MRYLRYSFNRWIAYKQNVMMNDNIYASTPAPKLVMLAGWSIIIIPFSFNKKNNTPWFRSIEKINSNPYKDFKDDTILHISSLVCRSYSAELVIFVCVFKNEGSLSIRNYWQGPVPVNKELLTGTIPVNNYFLNILRV